MKLKDKLVTVWIHDGNPLDYPSERLANESDADFWTRHHAAVFARFQSPEFEPDAGTPFTTTEE